MTNREAIQIVKLMWFIAEHDGMADGFAVRQATQMAVDALGAKNVACSERGRNKTSKYIELHRFNEPMYIRAESINAVRKYTQQNPTKKNSPKAEIVLSNLTYDVDESYEEVKAMLL